MKDNWEHGYFFDFIDKIVGGGTPSRKNVDYWKGNIPWASVKDFESGRTKLVETEEKITELGLRYSSSNLIPSGIPIICTRMAVGRCAISNIPIAINQDLKAIFPNQKLDTQFLLFLLSYLEREFLNLAIGSTVKGISLNALKNFKCSIPKSLPQQKKIAKILSTCDEVIEKTEAAIAKYKAIKQGMMHDLFTRGIDTTTGKLRPSYQEAPELYKESALGMIPKEWEVKRLEEIIDKSTVITYGIVQTGEHIEGGIRVLRTVNLKENGIDSSDLLRTTKTISDSYQRTLVKENDIVCNVRASVGDFNIITKDLTDCNLTRGVARISVKEGINPFFILWFLRTITNKKQMSLLIKGTTFIDINIADLRKIYVFVPINQVEQDRVADKMQTINTKLQAEESALQKYKKIKEGLMQDLLTGRVEVSE